MRNHQDLFWNKTFNNYFNFVRDIQTSNSWLFRKILINRFMTKDIHQLILSLLNMTTNPKQALLKSIASISLLQAPKVSKNI